MPGACGCSGRGHAFSDIADSDGARLARRAAAGRRGRPARRARSRSARACATASSPRRCTRRGWRCTTWPRCRTSRSPARSPPATHGSGDRNGNLATAVAGVELVTASGELLSAPPGRRGLRRPGRRARRAGHGDPHHARRRAGLRRAPAGLRGPSLGRPVRALRRDHGARRQRQRCSPAGARRPEQVWVKSRVTERRSSRARALRRARPHPRPAPDRRAGPGQLHRRSSASRAPGPTGCRTSAWASRRAAGRSSSPSTSCRAAALAALDALRALGRRSRRCSRCRRSALRRPTTLWMSPQHGRDTVSSTSPGSASPRRSRGR